MTALLQRLLAAILTAGALVGTALAQPSSADDTARDYLSFRTEDEANTTDIYRQASPAVVYVTSTALRRNRFSMNIEEIPQGSGTGIIWNDQGLIITNFHVIAAAQRLTVTLADRSTHNAEVIGIAPEKDLAVLRIEAPAEALVTLPLGDSSELEVGRKVLAIGNPFGLDTTLTTGVVSAMGREINAPNNRRIRGVIQTDAAINPGNSGGPLLNSMGQLIGINTAIYSPSGASAGIGFAIPVNTVKEVVPQLIAYGRIMRPVTGVELASDRWARRYGIQGIPIVRIFPGMPAEEAGLIGAWQNQRGEVVLGDVITAIDDQPVTSNDDFLSYLERKRPGDEVTITTERAGETRTFQLRLAESQ